MTKTEIAEVLSAHGKWLRGEVGGKRAVLTGAVLTGAVLTCAVLRGADLRGADLTRAVLRHADLTDADLTCAVLRHADLTDADLTDADLRHAVLTCAVLRGADLRDADLRHAVLRHAVLMGADLTDADLTYAMGLSASAILLEARRAYAAEYRATHPEVPVVEGLDAQIYAAVTSGVGILDMTRWHSCETSHCRAGWTIVKAGEAGRALEDSLGTDHAARMIYRASAGYVPDFFASDEAALEDLKRAAEEVKS